MLCQISSEISSSKSSSLYAGRQLLGRDQQADYVQTTDASANTKDTSEYHNPTPVTTPTAPRAKSAAPAGTVLKGLGFLQNKPQPVALPDEEYPSWLWSLLDADSGIKPGKKVEVHIKGESVSLDKRELRKKNRDSIRVSRFRNI